MTEQETTYRTQSIAQKLSDYRQLGKMRLSLVVVLSAGMTFLIGSDVPPHWSHFLWLMAGGLLITLGANSVNEVLEIPYDALMKRTVDRPLPARRMAAAEALIFAAITTIVGTAMLWVSLGMLCALLGLGSMLVYAFVYTPAKRHGHIAVYIGAIPGALPALIGWAGATNSLSAAGWTLFAIQFFWQLPHFWSIAWLAHEDYTRAGFRLMPFGSPGKKAAIYVLILTLVLMPLSLLPQYYGIAGLSATYWLLALSALYTLQVVWLLAKGTRGAALGLMFGSFIYLPAVHWVLYIDKF